MNQGNHIIHREPVWFVLELVVLNDKISMLRNAETRTKYRRSRAFPVTLVLYPLFQTSNL